MLEFLGKSVYRIALLFAACFVTLGLIADKTQGMPDRFGGNIHAILETPTGDTSGCHNKFKTNIEAIENGETCVIGAVDANPHIAIIGDSHASRITDALVEELTAKRQAAVTYNASWCVPLLGLNTTNKRKRHCRDFIEASMSAAINNPKIKTIILSGQWANVTKGKRWGEDGKTIYGFSDERGSHVKNNPAIFQKALYHTMDILKESDKKIVIIGSIPEFETVIPYTLAKFELFGKTSDLAKHETEDSLFIDRAAYEARNRDVLINFDHIQDEYDVEIIDPYPVYCSTGYCHYQSEDGVAFYEDSSHLTKAGAIPLAQAIAKAF